MRPPVLSCWSITTRIITDSNAMLPPALVERYGIVVVPLTVVIAGTPFTEDVIDLDSFYDELRRGIAVSTSAPSPGEIHKAYEQVIADGCDSILSIHVGSNQSATVSAARVAARDVGASVRIVDTGAASFIEGCCVWRAAEVLADGGTVAEAADEAEAVGAASASVFTIGEIARAKGGGRLAVGAGEGVPVFASAGSAMHEVGRAVSQSAAVAMMTERVAQHPGPFRVGVGHADAADDAAALEAALQDLPQVVETIRYVVGASVAAHTGAGTFGAVFHPLPVSSVR